MLFSHALILRDFPDDLKRLLRPWSARIDLILSFEDFFVLNAIGKRYCVFESINFRAFARNLQAMRYYRMT